jgi:hypothetical protein
MSALQAEAKPASEKPKMRTKALDGVQSAFQSLSGLLQCRRV